MKNDQQTKSINAEELVQQLSMSDGKTPVMLYRYGPLEHHTGVEIQASRNKYKNGFAITVVGKSGRYSVSGCQHWRGTNLDDILESAKCYIAKWGIQ